jgi:hypothetical protein
MGGDLMNTQVHLLSLGGKSHNYGFQAAVCVFSRHQWEVRWSAGLSSQVSRQSTILADAIVGHRGCADAGTKRSTWSIKMW